MLTSKKWLRLIVVLCATMSLVSAIQAQPIELPWYTVDAGGQTFSTGGSFELGGTIGQPDARNAPVMAGGAFELTGGFWPVAQACFCLGDLNHDGNKDGRDIQKFVGCIIAGGDCSCADVDQVNGVTLNDVTTFVGALLAGNSCP